MASSSSSAHEGMTASASASASAPAVSSLPTPERCIADFCLIPLGTPTPSVSQQIAEVQRIIKKSGLEYSMHSAGTTVEGTWAEVMAVIGHAHTVLHDKGISRIQTDIRVGTRTDKIQHFDDKVTSVEKLLAADPDKS